MFTRSRREFKNAWIVVAEQVLCNFASEGFVRSTVVLWH